MNDDQRLLAHAALDGELTAEEQARAGADPEIVAEVERLRAVRAGLRAVEPPPPAQRQALLAAALDAFDTGAARDEAPRVVAPPPPSLAARRRARWLLPAAAAALVGVAAVGAIVGTDGSDDDSGDASDAVIEAPAGADLASTDRAVAAEEESTGAAEDDGAFGTVLVDERLATASLVLVRNPDELAAYAATAAVRTADVSSEPGDVPTTTARVGVEATTGGDTTAGRQTEAADGTVLDGAAEPTAVGPTCPVDGEYLGTVSYGSEPETARVVDVVRRGDIVLALAVEGCVEVAVAAGP